MHQLAKALRDRFMRGGNPDYLSQASDLCKIALAACPKDTSVRQSILEDMDAISELSKTDPRSPGPVDSSTSGSATTLEDEKKAFKLWNLIRETSDSAAASPCFPSESSGFSLFEDNNDGSRLPFKIAQALSPSFQASQSTSSEGGITIIRGCLKVGLSKKKPMNDHLAFRKRASDSRTRYYTTNRSEDLEEYGEYAYKAFGAKPPGTSDIAHDCWTISLFHLLKLKLARDPTDAELATDFGLEAFQACVQKDKTKYARQLADVATMRYLELQEREYFDEAVKYLFIILESFLPSQDDERFQLLLIRELETLLRRKIEEPGPSVLEEAIGHCRRALCTVPEHSAASSTLTELLSEVLDKQTSVISLRDSDATVVTPLQDCGLSDSTPTSSAAANAMVDARALDVKMLAIAHLILLIFGGKFVTCLSILSLMLIQSI